MPTLEYISVLLLLLLLLSLTHFTATMSDPEVHHAPLNATFKGIERNDEGLPIQQFLGIKYASVPARFERAEPVESFAGAVIDATKYGYVNT